MRCCSKISLENIFGGYVEKSREALEECMNCCQDWKNTYDRISKMHNKCSSEGWVLDESSIFAHVDAFIQRCRDLMEVVDGLVHFAHYSEGQKQPLPFFSGCKGPEMARNLREIEQTFEKHLLILKAVQSSVLDVKATVWHQEYKKYRKGMKDLEVMMQNVINGGFETITTVQEGVELLDVFTQYISREVKLISVHAHTYTYLLISLFHFSEHQASC